MNQVWLAFITGLTTGGFSCFAVQGGLLASAITSEEAEVYKQMKSKALIAFLVAKILAYTLLGLLLGLIGKSLIISPKFQGWLQIIIGIYMLITAARILNLHPIFKRFVIQPPKFIFKFLREESKVKSILTPIFLGFLTVLIPCGVTQAMLLLALGTGSPFWGAFIMFSFTLGTSPVFFAIGYAANEALKHKSLAVLSAIVIVAIGLVSINSGQTLRGSAHTFNNYVSVIFDGNRESKQAQLSGGVQEATIIVNSRGYVANVDTLKVGVPVRLKLITNDVRSCALAFTIPDLNISKILPVTGSEIIEFTPNKVGRLVYSCSMGMYSGYFQVVE